MKRNVILTMATIICWFDLMRVCAADSPEINRARQYGAKAKITFRVVDSKSNIVVGASVHASFYNASERNEGASIRGVTDKNGIITATGNPTGEIEYWITKDGYYQTQGKFVFYRPNDPSVVKDGSWQPWNPTNTVVLKEVRHPVPMFAAYFDYKTIPVIGSPIGFDLERGDWVAPNGKGQVADLYVNYSSTNRGGYWDYSNRLVLSFSNRLDGLSRMSKDTWSKLVSVYEAPTNGYQPELFLHIDRTTYKILSKEEVGDSEYLVFRVRTQTDDKGNIIKATYGKIYGPIEYGLITKQHSLNLTYYFNSDGTRNMEFDPKSNLSTNLPSSSEVDMP